MTINSNIAVRLNTIQTLIASYGKSGISVHIGLDSYINYKDEVIVQWEVRCYDLKINSSADSLEAAVHKFISMVHVQLGSPMEANYPVALPAPKDDEHGTFVIDLNNPSAPNNITDAVIDDDGVPF